MIVLLLTEAVIIAAIIVLERISAGHNWITSVPSIPTSSTPHFSVSDIYRYGFLWTTLPSFLMAIYGTMWNTIVSSTAERQPILELRRPKEKAANTRVTIMLDYRSYPRSTIGQWHSGTAIISLVLQCSSVWSFPLQSFHSQRTCSFQLHRIQHRPCLSAFLSYSMNLH